MIIIYILTPETDNKQKKSISVTIDSLSNAPASYQELYHQYKNSAAKRFLAVGGPPAEAAAILHQLFVPEAKKQNVL